MKYCLLTIVCIILISSCGIKTNADNYWKELDCGLYESNNGDLALKTQAETEEGIIMDKFITELCCDEVSLKTTIDTTSFKKLSSSYYKDKNNVYIYFTMSDGGNFWILEEADVASFEVLGDCYAKDKEKIFDNRARILDSVDYDSFNTTQGIGCYAKDKNGYYFWDQHIDLRDVHDSENEYILDNLQKL
jgi:hypothetical protein